MTAQHDVRHDARSGRSHSTPATSTTLALAAVALLVTAVHGLASADWVPLGAAAVAAWAVFLPALGYDTWRIGREP